MLDLVYHFKLNYSFYNRNVSTFKKNGTFKCYSNVFSGIKNIDKTVILVRGLQSQCRTQAMFYAYYAVLWLQFLLHCFVDKPIPATHNGKVISYNLAYQPEINFVQFSKYNVSLSCCPM